MDTVQEINERATAVKDLERQLLGLHQIFLDMAVLVEAQGEMLDNIETQVRARRAWRLTRLTWPAARCLLYPGLTPASVFRRWRRRMST